MDFREQIESKRKSEITKKINTKAPRNVCCGQPMTIKGTKAICAICDEMGIFEPHNQPLIQSRQTYVAIGGVKHNVQQEYPITQREAIRTELAFLQGRYFDSNKSRFPDLVLAKVVDLYSQVQQYETRRGRIKDEMLAALIYYECINEGANRRRKDVAAFMSIQYGGFSRGDNIVKLLVADGVINMTISDETIVGYTDRYLEILGIKHPTILQFDMAIIAIIERAIHAGINTKSMVSSKVIGAIWFIIVKRRFDITQKNLEDAVDGTKRNTFLPFYNDIIGKKEVFADIIEQYELM